MRTCDEDDDEDDDNDDDDDDERVRATHSTSLYFTDPSLHSLLGGKGRNRGEDDSVIHSDRV